MTEPLFWLGLSTLLVAVSLTAVLVAALPAFQELAHAARSAEKLFDTLNRELPPTLEAIRLTGVELTNLTDDVGQNVQAAGRVVGQIDQSITGVKQQARQLQITTQSVAVGLKAAWQTFKRTDRHTDMPQSQEAASSTPSQVSEPKLAASKAHRFDDDKTTRDEIPQHEITSPQATMFDEADIWDSELAAPLSTPLQEPEKRSITETPSPAEKIRSQNPLF